MRRRRAVPLAGAQLPGPRVRRPGASGTLASVERVDGEIPPGGMRVPRVQEPTTDTEHALQVLWADSRSKASTRPAGRAEPGSCHCPRLGGRSAVYEKWRESIGRRLTTISAGPVSVF